MDSSNLRFKMAKMTLAEASKFLTFLAQSIDTTEKWKTFETILTQLLFDACKAGAEHMRERAAAECERKDIQWGNYPEDAAPHIRALEVPDVRVS